MQPSVNWDIVRDIFNTALETPPADRDAWLTGACGDGTDLRLRVDALLASYGAAGDFFDDLGEIAGTVCPIPQLEPGACLAGRFMIAALVGRGGSGDVYEATDSELNESVALKLLRSGAIDEEYWDQFRGEVRLARHISSPHVCRVYDVGRHWLTADTELLFLTMELIRGRTLAQILREDGPPAPEAAFEIARQLASGLAAAHEAGVVHGDLKSSNVMVSAGTSRVSIMDFGLARHIGASSPIVGGTPAYLAPEQVASGAATMSSDVFSFGVIVFELLTGRLPWSGANGGEIANARLNLPAPRVRSLRPGSDSFWDGFVEKCLARDSDRRFASATHVASELLRWKRSRVTRRRALSAVVPCVTLGAITWKTMADRARDRNMNTVAVLPFEVVDAPADAGGAIAEQLTNTLSKVPGMKVVASPSVAAVSGQTALASIGSELNVRAIISGTIRETAGNAGISARLTDASTGRLLWSETFPVRPQDVRAAHETIARSVIRTLAFQLQPEQSETLRRRFATSDDAYRFYLLGAHFTTKRDGDSLLESLRYLKQAVDADGNWAVAWGALANAYLLIASKGVMPAADAHRLADQLGRKTLDMDERVSDAHLAIAGVAEDATWLWKEAEQHYRRAAALDPGSSEVHIRLAGFLSIVCRFDEALAEGAAAVDMDPLSIHVASFHATHLYRARRFAEAVERLEWILRRQAGFLNAQLRVCDCYMATGRAERAVPLARDAVERTGRAGYALSSLGQVLGLTGRRDEALAVARELQALYTKRLAAAGYIAWVYRSVGDFDATFAWLERSLADRDSEITTLKCDPVNDILRPDPRYGKLVADIGLL